MMIKSTTIGAYFSQIVSIALKIGVKGTAA
jgi:hypothetical protein